MVEKFSLSYSVKIRSDYIKVIDGNGRTVLSRFGYSYAPQKPFVEAPYGNGGSISVQIYLYRYSRFKLQFGILKQGLQSGKSYHYFYYFFASTMQRQ